MEDDVAYEYAKLEFCMEAWGTESNPHKEWREDGILFLETHDHPRGVVAELSRQHPDTPIIAGHALKGNPGPAVVYDIHAGDVTTRVSAEDTRREDVYARIFIGHGMP